MVRSVGSSKTFKHSMGEEGPYCKISGNKPSLVTLQNRHREPDKCTVISRIYTRVVRTKAVFLYDNPQNDTTIVNITVCFYEK